MFCFGYSLEWSCRCSWPRGKVLGGSSVLNYMLYVRGNRRDYDSWAAMGNYGWSYNEVLPYFIKSEDNRNPYLAQSPYHGVGGYLTVQESPYKTPLATAFVEGGIELGKSIARYSCPLSFLLNLSHETVEKKKKKTWQQSRKPIFTREILTAAAAKRPTTRNRAKILKRRTTKIYVTTSLKEFFF